ncbi:MAG TPA: hypothetical protein VK689_23000 [Armatimonadota bacterium]|nr:hypothetical protein [Armatimonadota bacterium]
MSGARTPAGGKLHGVVSVAERHVAIEIRFVKGLLADLPLDALASRLRMGTRLRGLEAELGALIRSIGR